EVKAYRDPARTVLIGELPPSTIVVGADTEGGVRIDSSVGDDEVLIDATLAVDVTVYGGRGNDTIRGGAGADILVGGEGDDTIRGGGGRDGIYGGADHDNLDGGAGDDYLSGDEGNDALAGGSGADVLLGGAGDDVLMGGADADRLHGNDGGDQLDGEGGDDLLSGGSETDRLQGGPGQDELIGGAGVDYLDGGADADRMHDADGTDVIIFDASNFGIFGGLGSGAAIATGSPLASGPIAFGTSALGTTSGLVSAAADSSGSTAVNGPLTGAQAGAIGDGLTWLGSWTAGLGGPLPIGAGAVGSILGDVISRALARPVASYLKGTSGPTIQGVVDVINTLAARVGAPDLAIATRGIRASVAGAEVRFDLQLGVTRSGALRLPDLGADLPGIGTGGAVPLSATVDLDIAFGVDGGGSFFVTLPGHGLALRTQVDATRLDFPIAIGLLAADARDGWIRMDARTTVAVPDADGDGRFAIADLTQVPAGAVTLATAGSLLAELPYAARLGDFADQGVVSIVHPDLSDPAARSVRLDGSEHARGFAAVSTATVVEWLRKATNWLGTVANNPALGGDVPFARGLTWGEVADFASVFRANVLDVLVEEGGMPSFRGAQGLIDKLAAAVGIGPDVLALDYDPLTRELTFRIDASAGVQHDVPLDLGHDFGRLAGVTINEGAQLHLAATITAGLAFGVSLAPRAEPPSGGTTTQQLTAALDRFFLREVALKVDAVATVADIDGTARLGLFNIGLVDGSASARVGVSVTVTDPGRDFRDLVVTPVLSGSAQANLPVRLTADVAGLTFPLDTGLVIAWPDVTRTETLSARLEPAVTLDSLLGSVESVAMGQIIEAVDRAIDFLHGVQERGFFQERLPVVNRSLADLLDTADRLEALKRDLEANPPKTINELIGRVKTLFGKAGAGADAG
ncbi:MAG TPA: calcium-binding protein, partial [Isosphaeraceae bacterium]